MNNTFPSFLLTIIISFAFSNPNFAKIIYVNANTANSTQDGTSWQDAYADFQLAIDEAAFGDSIWVAQGTYFPTAANDRNISFELKNGVKWFGGFQGNEIQLDERDFENFITRVSGDIGVQGDSLDNSFHVVYVTGLDSLTAIDGFYIERGQAIDPDSITSGSKNYGAGMLLEGATTSSCLVKILNCNFQYNAATYGGAIGYGSGVTFFDFVPYVKNCSFYNNRATLSGGGIFTTSGTNNNFENLAVIVDCHFESNEALFRGGAIYISNSRHNWSFLDNTFLKNKVFKNGPSITAEGGAVALINSGATNTLGKLNFSNCDFTNNSAKSGGGIFVFIDAVTSIDSLEIQIEKSHFFGNNTLQNFGEGSAIKVSAFTEIFNFKSIGNDFYEHSLDNSLSNDIISIDKFASFSPINGIQPKLTTIFHENIFENNENANCIVISSGPPVQQPHSVIINNSIFSENLNIIRANIPELNSCIINNCTFWGNEGTELFSLFTSNGNTLNLTNSILYQSQSLSEIFDDRNTISGLQGFNIHHSLLQSPDCLVDGIDACGDGMLFNIYPEFRDTLNGDFSLRSCSPALNQGDNELVDSLGILFDIEGNPRILDNAVDMGAYETQEFEIFSQQVQDVTCAGLSDGSISWPQHGTPPYEVGWDNGIMMGTTDETVIESIPTGDYSIVVTDADNCSETFTKTVDEPLPIEISATIMDATSENILDGNIEVMVSGGIPEYQFLWSNGDTIATIENLLTGTYVVTVVDVNNCFIIQEFEVGVMTDVNDFFEKNKIQLLPNISQQNTSVNLFFENLEVENYQIEIYNSFGVLVFFKKIKTEIGEHFLELQSPDVAGLFFIQIKNERSEIRTLKWIVE